MVDYSKWEKMAREVEDSDEEADDVLDASMEDVVRKAEEKARVQAEYLETRKKREELEAETRKLRDEAAQHQARIAELKKKLADVQQSKE